MKRLFVCITVIMALATAVPAFAAKEIKLAIVAPEGSTWATVVREWNEELKSKTGGQVAFKVYAGGVQGDERDVLRKMKVGQLDAAGFTGLGLGIVNPEVRILELPFLFRDYAEVDRVTAKIQPKMEAGFAKKGFILLGWAEAGFVNIFSNKPITKLAELKGVKMWLWDSDPLVTSMCNTFDIVPIPLALTDVLTSLQTNLIDATYAPPLGAIALQWFTRTKYYTTDRLSNSTGAFLISKRAMGKLTPSEQKVLKETARKYSRELVRRERQRLGRAFAGRKNPISLARLLGGAFIWRYVTGRLTIADIVKRANQILGCEAMVVDSPYPEICFDVDKPEHIAIVERFLGAD